MQSPAMIVLTLLIAIAWNADSAAVGQTASAEDVSALISQLNSGSQTQKFDAAAQLADLGPFGAPAVAALSKGIHSDDVALAYECLIAIGNIGPLAADAGSSVEAIALRKGPLQATASDTLRKIGTASESTVGKLQSLTTDSVDSIAVASIRCLNALRPNAVDEEMAARVVRALSSERSSVRNEGIAALAEMGQIAVPSLQKALENNDENIHLSACQAIEDIGADAADVAPQLRKLLSSRNERIVRVAALALGSVASQPDKSLPDLKALLKNATAAVRADAVAAIGGFGNEASSLIPSVVVLLKNDDSDIVRVAAADALGRIGAGNKDVASALAEAIRDPQGAVTIHAANSLSQLGPIAVAPLSELLENKDYAHLAAGVLAEMGADAKSAVEGLSALLKHEDRELRREAFIALASMGQDAKAAVPTLLNILHESTLEDTQAGAAYVLGKIGEQSCVGDLKKIMAGPGAANTKLKLAAAWSLVNLRSDDDEIATAALPTFVHALDSEEPIARREAIAAIATLGSQKESTMAKLARLAQSDADATVQAEALHALAELNAAGSDVLTTAISALDSDDSDVRNAATYLLGKLGSSAKPSASRLRNSTRTGPEFDRMVAAWALVRVDGSAEHKSLSLPLMLKALNLPAPEQRIEAIHTIAMIGISNSVVKSALNVAAASDDEGVSSAAKETLQLLK